jgi:hypothetical protein
MAIKTTARIVFLVFNLLVCVCAYGQKKQRIKQIWHYNPESLSNSYMDSLVFFYSGNRGSECNPHRFNGVDYAFPYDVLLRTSPYPAVRLPLPLYTIYEPSVQYDSLYRYSLSNLNINRTLEVYHNTYERDTAVIHAASGFAPTGAYTYETFMVYNEHEQPLEIYNLRYNWLTQKTDTAIRRHIYYDAQGRAISDSSFALGANATIYTSYAYNSKGQVETIYEKRPFVTGIQNFVISTYNYDTAGNVTSVLQQYLDEDVLMPLARDVMEYDPQNRLVLHTKYEGDSLIGYKREIYYDNNGDPYQQDVRYYSGGNLFTCELLEIYYNQYHNPDSAITWIDQCHLGLTRHKTTIYTYETYGEDTGSVTRKRKPFIYPNPARDVVHIQWHKDFSKQPLAIKLYNATGQEMRRYTILQPSLTNDLNTQGLPPGLYLLRINTANANEYIYSGKIVLL